MISGALAAVLGAKEEAKQAYTQMADSAAFHSPKAWAAPEFSLLEYDVLILPGGHDKSVKQIIESESLSTHLREFFPLTRGEVAAKKKVCGAIWCVFRSSFSQVNSVDDCASAMAFLFLLGPRMRLESLYCTTDRRQLFLNIWRKSHT
jgi:hypothetical protein